MREYKYMKREMNTLKTSFAALTLAATLLAPGVYAANTSIHYYNQTKVYYELNVDTTPGYLKLNFYTNETPPPPVEVFFEKRNRRKPERCIQYHKLDHKRQRLWRGFRQLPKVHFKP